MRRATTAVYPGLMVLMAGAMALALAGVSSPLRGILGLGAVLFIPGYLLVGSIFPRHQDLGWPLRIGLSLAVSLALHPLLAVLLAAGPGSFTPVWTVSALTVFSLAAGGVAWFRARGTSVASVDLPRPDGRTLVVGALACAAVIGTLLAVDFSSRSLVQDTPTTEFYLASGPTGFGEDAMSTRTGEPVTLVVGITNREGREMRYRLSVRAGDRGLAEGQRVTLPDGGRWQGPVTFSLLQPAGLDEVALDVVLQVEGEPSEDYRVLRVWLRPA